MGGLVKAVHVTACNCNCDHMLCTRFQYHCVLLMWAEKILSTSKPFRASTCLHVHKGKIWEIPNIYINFWFHCQFFFSGWESTTAVPNFPPRNAAVQRVPVPRANGTEVSWMAYDKCYPQERCKKVTHWMVLQCSKWILPISIYVGVLISTWFTGTLELIPPSIVIGKYPMHHIPYVISHYIRYGMISPKSQ